MEDSFKYVEDEQKRFSSYGEECSQVENLQKSLNSNFKNCCLNSIGTINSNYYYVQVDSTLGKGNVDYKISWNEFSDELSSEIYIIDMNYLHLTQMRSKIHKKSINIEEFFLNIIQFLKKKNHKGKNGTK